VLFDVHGGSHSHSCCSHTGITHEHDADHPHSSHGSFDHGHHDHSHGHSHNHSHEPGHAGLPRTTRPDELHQPLLGSALPAAGATPQFAGGFMLLVALAVHTFLECMALGLLSEARAFWTLFAAIAAHKLISALALSSRFIKEGATSAQVGCRPATPVAARCRRI
jgi:zinc transporter ZupT